MRIIATIGILIASVFAPWWWVAVLLVLGIFVFRGYPESVIIATIMIIRMYPGLHFGERIIWFGGACLVWAVLAFIASQIGGYNSDDLYV